MELEPPKEHSFGTSDTQSLKKKLIYRKAQGSCSILLLDTLLY